LSAAHTTAPTQAIRATRLRSAARSGPLGGQLLVRGAHAQVRAADLHQPTRQLQALRLQVPLALDDDAVRRAQVGRARDALQRDLDHHVLRRDVGVVQHHVRGRAAAHGEAAPLRRQGQALARVHPAVAVQHLDHHRFGHGVHCIAST
jgi:hypothetical protein